MVHSRLDSSRASRFELNANGLFSRRTLKLSHRCLSQTLPNFPNMEVSVVRSAHRVPLLPARPAASESFLLHDYLVWLNLNISPLPSALRHQVDLEN